jgi:hypothetical protein
MGWRYRVLSGTRVHQLIRFETFCKFVCFVCFNSSFEVLTEPREGPRAEAEPPQIKDWHDKVYVPQYSAVIYKVEKILYSENEVPEERPRFVSCLPATKKSFRNFEKRSEKMGPVQFTRKSFKNLTFKTICKYLETMEQFKRELLIHCLTEAIASRRAIPDEWGMPSFIQANEAMLEGLFGANSFKIYTQMSKEDKTAAISLFETLGKEENKIIGSKVQVPIFGVLKYLCSLGKRMTCYMSTLSSLLNLISIQKL